MLDNAEIDKLIIYALAGICVVLTIAVIWLAVKKNVYYEDEEGREINPKHVQAKQEPIQAAPVEPMMEDDAKFVPLNVDTDTSVYPMEEPLEVKGSAVKSVEVAVTINGQTHSEVITHFPCLMGRESASCSLVISEPAVSRRHAQIIEDNGTLYLEDVSEHNGTFLNGTKLPPLGRAKIHENDRISLGRAEIDILKLTY